MFAHFFLTAAFLAPVQAPAAKCIAGRVIVEGNGPIPGLTFTITGGPRNVTASVWPAESGSFGILLPSGGRGVILNPASLPQGYSVKSLTYGATDLLREPLTVSDSNSVELVVIFATAPGSWFGVSGRVTGIDPSARTYHVTMSGRRPLDAVVQPDGSFAFAKVFPGNYALELSAPGGIAATATAVVADKDVAVVIAAPAQREVTGRVVAEGGGRPRVYSFALQLKGSSGTRSIWASPGSDGVFKVALPEGENQVSIAGISPGSIKSLTYGDTDLLKGPLRVARTDTAELLLTVAADATSGVTGGIPFNGPDSCMPTVR